MQPSIDNRTFGEIEVDEQAQWDQVHRELRDHRFNSLQAATQFAHSCVAHTYRRLGMRMHEVLKAQPQTKTETEQVLWDLYQIRVSSHRPSQEDEKWQVGLYVYKDKELVAFVGRPSAYQGEIILSKPFYLVRTNVSLPGGKGVKFL